MKRRQFIENSLALTSMSLLPKWAFAQAIGETEPEFFLQFYMDGGWDTTLMSEAWNFQTTPDPSKIFIEYSQSETLAFGNSFVGPSLNPLKDYFSRMTIFNGVIMSPVEVGHPSPARFSVSGISDASEPSFVCQFMDLFYKNQPASIITNSSVDTGDRVYKIVSIESIASLGGFSGANQVEETSPSGGLVEAAYNNLGQVARKLSEIGEENKESLAKVTNKDIQLLLKGFLSRLYPSAFIKTSRYLDTHSSHIGEHKKNLMENFETIAKYLDGLNSIQWKKSGKTLLDLTTVVISSDFTRTPVLNVSGGKDHNPFSNSMIVLSPKFKPYTIVGRSRILESKYSPIGVPILLAMPVDIDTLNPVVADKNTAMITPSVVYGSLLDASGKVNASSPEAFQRAFKMKSLYR